MNDILITTTDGQLLFFNYDGTLYTNYTYQVKIKIILSERCVCVFVLV